MKILTSCCPLCIAQVMLLAKPAPAPPFMETPNGFPVERPQNFSPQAAACQFWGRSDACLVRHAVWQPKHCTASCWPAGDLESCRSVLSPWWSCWHSTSPLGTPLLSPPPPPPFFFCFWDGCTDVCNRLRGGNMRESPAQASLPWRLWGLSSRHPCSE